MRIEDEKPDVLQNIEFVVAQHYRSCPDLTDYSVMRVYEAPIDAYAAEHIGRQARAWNPTEKEQELFAETKDMCEWRLGRNPTLFGDLDISPPTPQELDRETLILCLKRLRRSVEKWTKRSGRQGYLHFMSQFVR